MVYPDWVLKHKSKEELPKRTFLFRLKIKLHQIFGFTSTAFPVTSPHCFIIYCYLQQHVSQNI